LGLRDRLRIHSPLGCKWVAHGYDDSIEPGRLQQQMRNRLGAYIPHRAIADAIRDRERAANIGLAPELAIPESEVGHRVIVDLDDEVTVVLVAFEQVLPYVPTR